MYNFTIFSIINSPRNTQYWLLPCAPHTRSSSNCLNALTCEWIPGRTHAEDTLFVGQSPCPEWTRHAVADAPFPSVCLEQGRRRRPGLWMKTRSGDLSRQVDEHVCKRCHWTHGTTHTRIALNRRQALVETWPWQENPAIWCRMLSVVCGGGQVTKGYTQN